MADALKISNGLIFDFSINGAGPSDVLLFSDSSGNLTQASSLAVNRLVAQTPSKATVFDASGFITASSVTATELGYVSGVTSSIQTQLNAKQPTISLTANRAVVTNGSGVLIASATLDTEIGYVSGVTSSIQTQLNAKQATITGGATTIVSSNLTASRALVSDGSGKVAVSSVLSSELAYVSGVTSSIQTQLGTKLTVTITSPTSGQIISYNGSAWVNSSAGAGTLPVGGSANQYLTKIDGTNYNTQWSTLITANITDLTATYSEINILHGVTTTTAQLNYLNTTTSDVQVQINNKLTNSLTLNSIWVGNGANVPAPLSTGPNGYVLKSVSGVPTWQPYLATSFIGLTDVPASYTGANSYLVQVNAGATGLQFVATNSVGWPLTGSATITGNVTMTLPAADVVYFNAAGYTDTNTFFQWTSTATSYNQNIIQNLSSAATASTNFIVSNNLGTATTYYFEMGMNSSGFTGSGSFNIANAGYLDVTNGDLVIGTLTSNAIHFVINGGSVSTDAMLIDTHGKATFYPSATYTGLNVGTGSADPSTPSGGDLFYNTTLTALRAYINGAWVSLGAGGGGGTPGGSNTQLQYNNSGAFGGTSATYSSATGKVTFTPTATYSGMNIGTLAGNPSTLSNADIWYNSTTSQFVGTGFGSGITSTFLGGQAVPAGQGQIPYNVSANSAVLSFSSNFTYNTIKFNVGGAAQSSGVNSLAVFTGRADTGITTTTEQIDIDFALNRTVTWASSSTVATQRQIYVRGVTLAAASAGQVFTNAYSLYVDPPVAGTNASIGTAWAAGFNGNMWSNGQVLFGPSGTAFYSASEILKIRSDQNNGVISSVTNTTAGTSAYAGFFASTSSSFSGALVMITLSSSYATSGILVANSSSVYSNTGGGLNLGTNIAQQTSLWTNATKRLAIDGSGNTVYTQGALSSSWTSSWNYISGNHTIIPASSELADFIFNSASGDNTFNSGGSLAVGTRTKAWASGAGTVATQRDIYIRGTIYSSAGSSTTITNAYTLYVDAPSTNTSAGFAPTVTNNFAAGFNGNVAVLGNFNVTTSYSTIISAGQTISFTARAFNSFGGTTSFNFTPGASTNIATTSEQNNFVITGVTLQWAAGTVVIQRDNLIKANTLTGAAATAIFTDAATFAINGAPIKGTNASITNAHGLLIQSGSVGAATNSFGLTVNAQSGATNNYAAQFLGGTVIFKNVLSYTDTDIFTMAASSVNSFNQHIIQNTNSGTTASTNLIVSNNNGTATTYYGEFGMNSSGFTGSGSFNQPNYVYLDSTSADLVIGTTTSNAIHFVINGNSVTTDAMGIATTGKVLLYQTASYAAFNINGYTADPSTPTEGDQAYNTTSHVMKFYNGSTWVSMGGGGGITNSASNTELMMSDGTNATHSGLFVSTQGSLDLGSTSIAGDRVIHNISSSTDSYLSLQPKGVGIVRIYNGSFAVYDTNTPGTFNNYLIFQADNGSGYSIGPGVPTSANVRSFTINGAQGNATTTSGADLILTAGAGYSVGNTNGANLYLKGGAKNSSGTNGNVGFFTTSGSFGGGTDVAFIHDATTNPSTNPTAGYILYSDGSNLSHPTVRVPSGAVADIYQGGFVVGTVSATTQTLDRTQTVWVFTGSSGSTWTLPALSGNTNLIYFIKNRGTANITLQRAGADNIFDTAVVTSVTILPGSAVIVSNDGTYWNIM